MSNVAAVHTTRNQLLAALPPADLAAILPKLRRVSLTVRDSLITPDMPIEAVYFVESGWVSLVATLEDGSQAEVGLVGREGMVGLPLIVGVESAFEEAFVQADGCALQIQTKAFNELLRQIPTLHRLLYSYSEAMRSQTTQTAACNGRHPLEQRLARWLLMAHDRADGDKLPVTQEFLGLMLCVYRPTITVAAGILQRAGIIRYSRGHVEVLDRAALEATSCDCYATVKRRFDRLLGANAAEMYAARQS
ncbi:Crp/Fnr family transcriptional regulator [Rhodopila sp.]|uniref:Crp/Fnr family transcriptional regulator n=1 Tax=Rhodopila sp. TaxID=2480087 RepID=UPI003D114BC9